MRAVIAAVLVSVLAAGGAEAGECRLDGLHLVAKELMPSEIIAPQNVGAHFQIIKAGSNFKHTPGGDTTGVITIEIKGGTGQFVIAQEYTTMGMPKVYGASFNGPARPDPAWNQRNLKDELATFSGVFDIYSGPLAGLTLEAVNCP